MREEDRADDSAVRLAPALNQLTETLRTPSVFKQVFRPIEFTIRPGCRIIGTPFDHTWKSANAVCGPENGLAVLAGRGEFKEYSGFGLDITTQTPVALSFKPQGTYYFGAGETQNRAYSSRGGFGSLVFVDGVKVVSQSLELWSIKGGDAGVSDSGDLANLHHKASTDPWTFGPLDFAPILADLRKGQRLTLWIWGWAVGFGSTQDPSSLLSFRMPAVEVCQGPQHVIH